MANLTYEELKDIFTELTFILKGLNYNSTDNNVQKLVRRAYEQESQPFNDISDDTTYVWLTFRDDPTNELFNETKELVTVLDEHGVILNQYINITRSQTRVLEAQWIFYGDVAFDSSQNFRLKLFNDETYMFLVAEDIYLIRGVSMPNNTFEEIANRYWKRSDLVATFNVPSEVVEKINIIEQVDIDLSSVDIQTTIVVK